jgi:hypothetical protein
MLTSKMVKELSAGLAAAFPAPDGVTVTADPYQGARIRVISVRFQSPSPAKRRCLVLDQATEDQIAHLELLTPEPGSTDESLSVFRA